MPGSPFGYATPKLLSCASGVAGEGRIIVWWEMMLEISRFLLCVLLVGVVPSHLGAQEASQENQPEPQEQPQEPVQEAEEVPPPPRIVGKAQSQQEFDDWQVVQQTADPLTKIELANSFLETYPDSGLTAFAHQALAEAAFQQNDTEGFIQHAEKALLELPNTPELLAPLAFRYSEKRQIFKAIDYANRSLSLLDEVKKPAAMSSLQWITQNRGLRVRSHYAVGRSQLELWRRSLSPEQLQQAISHFAKALELDPEHAYAAFRLGYAQLQAKNQDAALGAYARAAVLDGPAADPSRDRVEKMHADLKKNSESRWAGMSVNEILKEERKRLEAELADIEQKASLEAAQLDSRALLESAVPPPPN